MAWGNWNCLPAPADGRFPQRTISRRKSGCRDSAIPACWAPIFARWRHQKHWFTRVRKTDASGFRVIAERVSIRCRTQRAAPVRKHLRRFLEPNVALAALAATDRMCCTPSISAPSGTPLIHPAAQCPAHGITADRASDPSTLPPTKASSSAHADLETAAINTCWQNLTGQLPASTSNRCAPRSGGRTTLYFA